MHKAICYQKGCKDCECTDDGKCSVCGHPIIPKPKAKAAKKDKKKK